MRVEFKETPGKPVTGYAVKPESPSEAVELNRVTRGIDPEKNPLEFAEFIQNPKPQEFRLGQRSERDGCGFVLAQIETQHVDPYIQMLQDRTGHCLDDHEATIDLVAALGQMKATRTLVSAKYTHGCIEVVAVVGAYGTFEADDDDGRRKGAERWLRQGIEDDLGQRHTEPEFIQSRNGQYKRNENYATGRHVTAAKAVKNEKVWGAIWGFWVENYASDAQKALLADYSTFRNGPTRPTSRDHKGFHVEDYKRFVSWPEFAELGGAAGR